jgi:hypothetical protein
MDDLAKETAWHVTPSSTLCVTDSNATTCDERTFLQTNSTEVA